MKKDPFLNLKYIAWCRSKTPPEGEVFEYKDLIEHARHYIASKKNVLFNDPVLKEYTPEELLVEYFALRFDSEKDFCDEFEAQMRGISQEDYEWFDRMTKEHIKETEENIGVIEFEDDFS